MNSKRTTTVSVAALLLLAAISAGAASARGGLGQQAAAPSCDTTTTRSYPQFGEIGMLAWASHHAVVGTVVVQLPSRAVATDGPTPRSEIYTDYIVRVDQQFRGQPEQTIVVRQLGGALNGCITRNAFESRLAVGVPLLLFLSLPEQAAGRMTYAIAGGRQGQWSVERDGTARNPVGHLQHYNGRQVAELGGEIRAALAGVPPSLGPNLVPLDRAPVPAAP